MGGNEFDDILLEPCDDLLLAEFGSLQAKLRKHSINFNPEQLYKAENSVKGITDPRCESFC